MAISVEEAFWFFSVRLLMPVEKINDYLYFAGNSWKNDSVSFPGRSC